MVQMKRNTRSATRVAARSHASKVIAPILMLVAVGCPPDLPHIDPSEGCGNGMVDAGERCDDEGESLTCDIDCTDVVCGDGIVNAIAGEACDRTELGEETCLTRGFDDGELGCSSSCTFDTSSCISFACGDGVINGADQCDGADLGGQTCANLGFVWGTLACGEGCGFDTDGCRRLPGIPELALGMAQVKRFELGWEAAEGAEYYHLLESPASGEPLVQLGGDILGESISISVPLYLRFDAIYSLRACNTWGCTESEPVSVAGSLVEAVGYFKASNTGANDNFGIGIALSDDGSTLAVGAHYEASDAREIDGDQNNDDAPGAGAVYVFARDAMDRWSQQAYIKAFNADAGDSFGVDVSLSADGNTLAVGAYAEDSNTVDDPYNGSAPQAGAAYVFVRDPTDEWAQQAYIKASNVDASDYFGVSVALSDDGNTLAVGAYSEDGATIGVGGNQADDSAPNAGAVYVLVRDLAGTWAHEEYVKASNTDAGDYFGISVALSADGDTLAVGADFESSSATDIDGDQNDDLAPGAGAVYVLVRDMMDEWSHQAYVKPFNAAEDANFGHSVALSDDGYTLAVGANGEASSNGDPSDDTFPHAGAVYVFERDVMDAWSQQAYLKASNIAPSDWFGHEVTLNADGDVLAVGAWGDTSSVMGINGEDIDDTATNAGAVYVLVRDPEGSWIHQAYVKASNTNRDDLFGYCVALSGDGNTLAVGAVGEASNATGIGADQTDDSAPYAGAVYLY